MSEKQRITAEDLYQIVYVEDPRISPDGRWIAYVQQTVDKLDNGYKRNIWLVPTAGGAPVQLTRSNKDTSPRWSPDGKTLAFVSSRDDKPQIYLLRIAEPGGEARALTSLSNGATNPVWSPDGTQMAFLSPLNAAERAKEDSGEADPKPADKLEGKQRKERKDHDETKRWDPRIVERLPYRSGTSYLTDRYNQIYVMPTADGLDKDQAKPHRLTHTDADHNAPQWMPDGQSILTGRIIEVGRDEPWRWSALFRIHLDGRIEQLTDDSYSSSTPLPSPDSQWIVYIRFPRERLSERITRLAIIPATGGAPRDLNLELDRSLGSAPDFKWSPDSQGVLFTVANRGDIELRRVDIAAGHIETIVSGQAHVENFDILPDGGLAYTLGTPANPSELYWRASGTDTPVQLTTANQQFLETVSVQEQHEFCWQAPDGQEIQGWYLLPADYEPGKTYPLALNIHGGPHIMWGPGMKTMWHEWQFQAARGYITFYTNPRGADGYGEAFQMALHGKWGALAYGDILAGVDKLIEQGLVDAEQLAVTGGSYGGYMATWIISHTDRFKAAVAQRGVYNLLGFPGVTDIPSFIQNEFGAEPWLDPLFLWQNSPVAHAQKIKTPLLLIHSENDYRVPISEAEQMFTYVRRNGGIVKLIRYPREGHEMTRTGEPEHRVSSLLHTVEWFDQYCQNQSGGQ